MNSQGPAIVHYEVYALDGQRWTLHARFRKEEKEDALAEAKMVENSLGFCSKVVREIYYPGNNASEETLVYSSEKTFRPKTRAAVRRPRAFARGEAGFDAAIATPDFRHPKTMKSTGSAGVLLKLMIVVAASLAIASGVTAIVNNFLAKFPGQIGADSAALLIFVTFVVTFLVSGVPLAMSVVDWRESKPSADARDRPRALPPKSRDVKAPAEEVKAAEVRPEPPEEPAPEAVEEEEDKPPPEDARQEEPETGVETAQEADALAETAPDPLESLRMIMIRFLSTLLSEIKKIRPSLDAYNIFGVDLILAGAIDVLGTQRNLEPRDKRAILKETIEVMGTKSETALAFSEKYEDYLVEPKYMSMVQVGRNNMEALLGGAEMALDQVIKVFESWNRPQQAAAAPARIVTVLFTDMVGSTDLTQARGDHAAQDIVRRHNSIVRTALAEYAGKEVKHTGDGIMASFSSTANGVEAAIVIQRACAVHNEKRPDLPLHLRIGLNAGEPIEEEDDLFGTTVQLSARVCAKADTDEILCTNVVRELSAGKDLSFTAKGVHDLKGFKDPVALYEVLWRPDAAAAPAAGGKKETKPKPAAAKPAVARDAKAKEAPPKDPGATSPARRKALPPVGG